MFNKKEQIRDIWGKTTILQTVVCSTATYMAVQCELVLFGQTTRTLNENKQPCLIEISKYVITTFTLLSFHFRVGKWQIFYFVSLLFCSQLTPLEIFQEQTQSGSVQTIQSEKMIDCMRVDWKRVIVRALNVLYVVCLRMSCNHYLHRVMLISSSALEINAYCVAVDTTRGWDLFQWNGTVWGSYCDNFMFGCKLMFFTNFVTSGFIRR